MRTHATPVRLSVPLELHAKRGQTDVKEKKEGLRINLANDAVFIRFVRQTRRVTQSWKSRVRERASALIETRCVVFCLFRRSIDAQTDPTSDAHAIERRRQLFLVGAEKHEKQEMRIGLTPALGHLPSKMGPEMYSMFLECMLPLKHM